MPTTRLLIEYDGTDFSGWAAQTGLRTVQHEIETALATIARTPRPLTVAGRTDAGVHARAQVASYTGEPVDLYSLNALLPRDVAILSCEQAVDGFDARQNATSRTYCFRLFPRIERSPFERRFAWHFPYPLDRALLDRCAAAIVGRHDFTAFTPADTYHRHFERTIYEAYWRDADGDVLEFWIRGQTFMRQMVRVIVGNMIQVANDRRDFAQFEALLAGAHRREGGPTAPPQGLHLMSVAYGLE
jgi:tRNA pseudouridine38-40 synthase